jgi:hypothetical protein
MQTVDDAPNANPGWLAHVRRLAPLLGVGLFVYILSRLDLRLMAGLLAGVGGSVLLAGAGLAVCIAFLVAGRWHTLLTAAGVHWPFARTCRTSFRASLLGELTPGRVGELVRAVEVATATGTSLGAALYTVVADRLYDVFLVVLLATGGCLVLLNAYDLSGLLWLALLFLAGIVALLGVLRHRHRLRLVLLPVVRILTPSRFRETAGNQVSEFLDRLEQAGGQTNAVCLGQSLLVWGLKLTAIVIFARSLGIAAPAWFLLAMSPLVTLVGLLPISVSGFGTREGTLIFFLSLWDVSAETAVALSLLNFAFGFVPTVLLALAAWAHEWATGPGRSETP